jgi:hypothetical protein
MKNKKVLSYKLNPKSELELFGILIDLFKSKIIILSIFE